MSYTVAFETLGCRLNQAESAIFVRQFINKGYRWVPSADDADLCIINTCTLTAQATAKCRRLIRSIARRNPDACIAAVGCYAQTGAEELATIDGLDYIVGTSDKMRLTEIIPSPVKLPEPVVVRSKAERSSFTIDAAGYYPVHTRANLKVQEGCNFVCSFCIIPRSRGPARSRDFDDILREARLLVDEGHRELIITGVNVGTYDDGGHTLVDIVDALEPMRGLDRIRLSSIEPTTIDDRLVMRMKSGGKLCSYLHVPLQSGSDGILERMRRKYGAADYVEFMDDVVARIPNVGLGADVIVGFPGEDEAAFQKTCDIIEAIPFNNIHVFSFSARHGTGAAGLPAQVAGDVIVDRSRRLHKLARAKRRQFYERQIGVTHRVLFEERTSGGRFVGFSDNYVKVAVESALDLSNRMGSVHVTTVGDIHGGTGDSGTMVAVGDLIAAESNGRPLRAHTMASRDAANPTRHSRES
jgi:threonylcarbamoyladenosine tRNA methylthiotransferase MtaB